MTTQNKKLKDEFKNVYSLNKTLRFCLIPDEKTAEILNIENDKKENFKKDRELAFAYKEIKKYLDELHQEFIQESMKNFSFSNEELEEFERVFLEDINFNDKDNQKEKDKLKNNLEKVKKDLAKKISSHFDKYSYQKYNTKISKKNILDKKVLDILLEKYKGDLEKENNIKKFKGFFTYLQGFKQNRENFYKGELKAGQFATRTIENLVQFIKNINTFKNKYLENYHNIGVTDEQIDIFNLDYFNNLFIQEGIDKYNGILGNKKGVENNTNDGINQKINIFKQKEKSRLGKEFKKSDYPIFKELYKQIGSKKKEQEDKFIEINSDEELVSELNYFANNYIDKYLEDVKEFYRNFFKKLRNNEYDLEKIYLSKTVGTYFSHLAFSDWGKLAYAYNKKWNVDDESKVKIGEGEDVNVQFRSLADLRKRFDEIFDDKDKLEVKKSWWDRLFKKDNSKERENAKDRWEYFWKVIERYILDKFEGGEEEIFDKISKELKTKKVESLEVLKEKYLKAVEKYKAKMVDSDEGLSDDEEKEIKGDIKVYLDRVKEIERIAKYFDLKKHFEDIKEEDKDSEFYFEYDFLLSETYEKRINKWYDEFRNYLTKNNVSEEKFKLNFDSGLLLDGWPITMESQKLSVIFRDKKDDKYYLGIINKTNNKILDKDEHPEIFDSNSDFQKMEYMQISDVSNEIQNLMVIDGKTVKKNGRKKEEYIIKFFENEGIDRSEWEKIDKENKILEFLKEKYLPEEINRIRKTKSYSISNENFNRDDLNKFIEYYKKRIIEYKKGVFEFSFKETSQYKSFADFTDHIASQDYKVKFVGINKDYIKEKVENGELFLFQIYNKDFSENKKEGSKENLHTLYFKELFSEENLKNPIFKLSGGGKIFFRDKIDKKREKYKKDNKGKDVLDKKRFSRNTLLLHLPIEINYGKSKTKEFNQQINKFIAKNQDVNILGIDRGEKELLYYSLIDLDGNVLEMESLNIINGVDYHQKLDQAEKERQENRKSWQKIEKIKNLKKGYISQVVKKIVDLAIENNAIIVLEDLSFGFKSNRQKIEKNVYQQFEKALIDKLNFVVDKEKHNQRYAPQLTAPFESFEKIRKQSGILYYVLAANTSKVCPHCQWRKNIFLRYQGKDTIKKLQEQYKAELYFDKNENRFKFIYKGEGDDKKVEVYSDVDRVRYDKTKNNNKGGFIIYQNDNKKDINGRIYYEGSITENLKELLFEKNRLEEDREILNQLNDNIDSLNYENSKYAGVFKHLIYLLNLNLNIRNSLTELNQDYIQCPVCHFDSRKENQYKIKDGDGNGAYNIALRGLYLLKGGKGIFNCVDEEGNYKAPKLSFKMNDYFQWIKNFKDGLD